MKESFKQKMQENKPPLTFKNTKKNICLEKNGNFFFDADPYWGATDWNISVTNVCQSFNGETNESPIDKAKAQLKKSLNVKTEEYGGGWEERECCR